MADNPTDHQKDQYRRKASQELDSRKQLLDIQTLPWQPSLDKITPPQVHVYRSHLKGGTHPSKFQWSPSQSDIDRLALAISSYGPAERELREYKRACLLGYQHTNYSILKNLRRNNQLVIDLCLSWRCYRSVPALIRHILWHIRKGSYQITHRVIRLIRRQKVVFAYWFTF